MLKIKLDVQKFSGGGQDFTAGVTKSAIEKAYDDFHKLIVKTNDAIGDFKEVRKALEKGWSGKDREDFLNKFDVHQQHVQEQIKVYDDAVSVAVQDLIEEWEKFQAGLIS